MAFKAITLTGQFLKTDGSYASGKVSFQLTAPMRDPATNVSIPVTNTSVTLNGTGSFSVALYATNSPGIVPTGVTYEVNERISGSSFNKYFITLNHNSPGNTMDLADIVPNVQPITTFNYATIEYVNTYAGAGAPFTPTSEILSTTIQGAIEEVRAKSKFVHTQASAATTWSITHNLKFYPNVSIVDSALSHVIGEVTYINENSLTVSFTSAFSGKAFLS
jgi:hypothetical protein